MLHFLLQLLPIMLCNVVESSISILSSCHRRHRYVLLVLTDEHGYSWHSVIIICQAGRSQVETNEYPSRPLEGLFLSS
jgi:hypothetical protein